MKKEVSATDSQSAAKTIGEIVMYQPEGEMRLEVRVENETVWLSQAQMAKLFERERSVIAKHIKNVFKEGELDSKVVCANFAHTTPEFKAAADLHKKQYPGLDIKTMRTIHDRFLLVDDKVYHFGASFKDMGNEMTAFSVLDFVTPAEVIEKIQESMNRR